GPSLRRADRCRRSAPRARLVAQLASPPRRLDGWIRRSSGGDEPQRPGLWLTSARAPGLEGSHYPGPVGHPVVGPSPAPRRGPRLLEQLIADEDAQVWNPAR